MVERYTYLQDSTFLKLVDAMRIKEQYVKITVLDWAERPIREIQGYSTSGSISLNGDSAIRRTCNLSMVAENEVNDLTNVDNLLSLNKKVEIEVGFLNTTGQYQEYPYIWFPQGIYIINNPSITHSLDSGVQISLQLKDKMCLLNGDCGGTIPSSVTLHETEDVDENGNTVITKPTIYQIIRELVNHFGGEQLSKIIISDVDTRVKQVMKWIGSTLLYIIKKTVSGVTQYTPTTSASAAVAAGTYNTYEYGDNIGYINTDFTYPGELIADAGSSVCDILDTIKSTLGNYEYYYDIYGNFIFQEKKNYLNTSQSTVEIENLSKDDYLVDMSKGKAVYIFDNSDLIISYSNSPQYNKIRNDFVVWGIRENASGIEVPIRYHLAIDSKPDIGNTYQAFFYDDPDDGITKAKVPIIFASKSAFPQTGAEGTFYMAENTGTIYKWNGSTKAYEVINVTLQSVTTKDWRTELYLSGVMGEPNGTDSNYYYTELLNEWPKLYNVQAGTFYNDTIKHPSDVDYYLDFIDSSAAISEFSISNIGRRTEVVSDDDINCIFEPEIPDLILLDTSDPDLAELRAECEARGQDYIQMSGSLYNNVATGGGFNSAYDKVREMLYEYTSYNESIALTTIPIYYLEPNNRITVKDPASDISGDYMISSITLPLDVASTMTISCTRALERL